MCRRSGIILVWGVFSTGEGAAAEPRRGAFSCLATRDPASTGTVAVVLPALNRDCGVTLIGVTHNAALAQHNG